HDLWHDRGLSLQILQPSLCLVLISALAMQTVAYFVSESSHHEGIDKSSLAGECLPLKSQDERRSISIVSDAKTK
ncbi:hypothetical protein BHM03_00051846, partial [Ensete ventricosum]